ncbi:MAG: M20/M25/M40 family metallo-hydrolase [Candidatus Thermoplasmatota archaeon]|nr:M20/M25/M40 family metallo-hydrolase [Candidatus Thermoplasmatota archaeon]
MGRKAKEVLKDLVLMKSTSEDDLRPIVGYVSDMLKSLGLKPQYYGERKYPAIVAQHRKGGVVLSGHLDTVPHGTGWKFEDGRCVGNRLYGRGACDMKAGCTAILLAAEELAERDVPFSLCLTTDEETTMLGAAAAAKTAAIRTAPAVLVAEPTDFDIVVKEKGLLQFSMMTKGVAAHASTPALGDNAIVKMLKLLSKAEDLQRIPKNPNNEMTMCVDTIRGGTRINVIPDECVAEIDVRYPPPMSTQKVLAALRKRIGKKGYMIEILHELGPVETDPKSRAVTILKQVIGQGARVTSVPYATEMVMFRNSNKTLMVCGPGDSDICHCNDEYVDIRQIDTAVRLYTEYCSRMA